MPSQIQLRRGTAQEWSDANPKLALAELGVEIDTNQFKIGNGQDRWNSLEYGGLNGPVGPSGPTGPVNRYVETLLDFDASVYYPTMTDGVGNVALKNNLHLTYIANTKVLTSPSIVVSGNTPSTLANNGALKVVGGVGVGQDVNVGGSINISSVEFDTGIKTNNSIYTAGGAWVDKTLVVKGQTTFKDSVFFNGTATYVYSNNTIYTDNLINMHTPSGGDMYNHNWNGDDGKDIGFVFHYFKGSDKNAFIGFNNDSGYLEWFENGSESPGGVFAGTTYGIFKTGGIKLVNTTAATNATSGALTVAGGVGVGGDLWVSGNVVASQVSATSNGQGTNFKVGDDAFIGDINTSDTMVVKGQQDNTKGYIVFGNADTTSKLGRSGTGPLTYVGSFSATNSGNFNSLGVGTNASGTTGEIRATNEITAYYSDRRLKTNVKLIEGALAKVQSLNGITYTPNEVAAGFGYDITSKIVGLFADEVESVLPEAVRPAPFDQDENGNSISGENYKTIQYEKLVPLLIEAVKELSAEVAELKTIIKSAGLN